MWGKSCRCMGIKVAGCAQSFGPILNMACVRHNNSCLNETSCMCTVHTDGWRAESRKGVCFSHLSASTLRSVPA